MRTLTLLVVAVLLAPLGTRQTARAEEPKGAALADRAKILRTEMRRGPAADLASYLAPDANPALRSQAIRALGRIGDRAGATEWLVKLLGGGADLLDVLRAAGLSGAAALEGPVVGHLASEDVELQTAALEALGWIGAAATGAVNPSAPHTADVAVRCASACARFLHAASPRVRAAALDALARCRQEAYLERAVAHLDASDAVADAAWFATWMLAGARKRVATSLPGASTWDGDAAVAAALAWGTNWQFGRQLDLIRAMGILQPAEVPANPARDTRWVRKHLEMDSDVRVLQELVARILLSRKGPAVDAVLAQFLEHADAKLRQAAAEALGEHSSPEAVAALRTRLGHEPDIRVWHAIAAALVHAGTVPNTLGLEKRPLQRLDDPLGRELRGVRVLAASKDPKVLESLVSTMRPGGATHPLVLLVTLGALEEHKSEAVSRFVGESLGHADPYVRAAAVGLVGKHLLQEHFATLDQLLVDADTPEERGVRQAVVEAWIAFAKADTTDAERRSLLRTRLLEVAHNDPAFTARAAVRKACKELNLEGCPTEDPLQPNDWRGLPRPKAPILGLDLTKGGPWLDEAEILQLADRMGADQPEFVVQNEVDGAMGLFRMSIDPSEAPVHAVSFLLAATSGVYEGTLWHRVVPSFVIQGGDPHGDGNGDAGWSVPDEITRARFTRGALGMPKDEIRDTGGCQLFVMHSDYRPLDGRYTCYGRVVDGMDTVDRIRVGDRITSIRMVIPERPPPPPRVEPARK